MYWVRTSEWIKLSSFSGIMHLLGHKRAGHTNRLCWHWREVKQFILHYQSKIFWFDLWNHGGFLLHLLGCLALNWRALHHRGNIYRQVTIWGKKQNEWGEKQIQVHPSKAKWFDCYKICNMAFITSQPNWTRICALHHHHQNTFLQ